MENSKQSKLGKVMAREQRLLGGDLVSSLVMRLYPTFHKAGLLSTFARNVLNTVPGAARHSLTLGTTTSGTGKIWKWSKTMIVHFESTGVGYEGGDFFPLFSLALKLKLFRL